MKTIIVVLALLVLASQAQLLEVTEVYKSFVANLPTDSRTKIDLINSGLECLTIGGAVAVNFADKFQQNIERFDYISSMRNVLSFGKMVQEKVVPICQEVVTKFAMFAAFNARPPQINMQNQALAQQLFEAKLIQLSGNVVATLISGDHTAAGKELALVASSALGLTKVDLPKVLEADPFKIVPINFEKLIPEFLKGFLGTFGIEDQALINGLVGCAKDVVNTVEKTGMNHQVFGGNFFNSANAMLDSFSAVNDAFERCTTVHKVDLETLLNFSHIFSDHPFQTLTSYLFNYVQQLPDIINEQNSFQVYLNQGQYELAGKKYALSLIRPYKNKNEFINIDL
jgi:hypothetical protein